MRTAINELAALVGYIVNNLNGHHVVVTADHGFLFTETARIETDKSKLKDSNSDIRCGASIHATVTLDVATSFPLRIEGEVTRNTIIGVAGAAIFSLDASA